MTKEELAGLLDGKSYREEISSELLTAAKVHGLVIVYGHSDDLMEFEGAIEDEFGCYDGGECRIDSEGVLPDRDQAEDDADGDDDRMEDWHRRRKAAKKIEAIWCATGQPAWTYKTKIPHATFNVMEDGEVQCRGLVFNIADIDP